VIADPLPILRDLGAALRERARLGIAIQAAVAAGDGDAHRALVASWDDTNTRLACAERDLRALAEQIAESTP